MGSGNISVQTKRGMYTDVPIVLEGLDWTMKPTTAPTAEQRWIWREKMKDRLGNDLHIGDVCVCYNNMGTGSSTNRLVQYEGEIIGFTQNFVKMKCLKCGYSEKTGREFRCYPDNVFKINPVVHGKWLQRMFGTHECSNCHNDPCHHDGVTGYTEWLTDFCPNCGADMRGEKE